ncbi:MAG: protein phosphatase 2C domain-containing protein [Phycisphaerae bacterium]|nr:protein phosphatase 2C domain-containing protein [Phycisphaerae bacterium]
MSAHHSDIQHDPEMFKGLDFNWAALTDTGLCRDKNEDAFLIEPEIGLFLVSDGMGGHPGGDLASDFVAGNLSVLIESSLHSLRSQNTPSIRRLLKRSIHRQSNEVRWEGQSESGYANMGATVVLCLLIGGRAHVANLGDSRLYRLRKNNLMQISRDHSVVNELIEAGKLEPENADGHHASGLITQYMGMDEPAEPDIRSFKLCSADRLLLCSDGLTDMLDETEIKTILQENADPQKAAKTLVELANKAGGYDNITVIVIDWF